jgi:hypothetical protein
MKIILICLTSFILFSSRSQSELFRFEAIRLCDSVNVNQFHVRPNLHNVIQYKDSTTIQVRLQENCGLNYKQGAFSLLNDTLNLLYTENNMPLEYKNIIYENGTWFHLDSLRVVHAISN